MAMKFQVRSRSRVGLTALAVLCLGATLAAAPAASATAAARSTVGVRVIEENINYGLDSSTLPNLESDIRSENPDVVMIIEICRADVQKFQADFPTWHSHFTPNRTTQQGCAKATGGVANPYSKGELLGPRTPSRR